MNKFDVILDMDETLVHTLTQEVDFDPVLDQRMTRMCRPYLINYPGIDGKDRLISYNLWGLTRPYLDQFLLVCYRNFRRVFIWSAGTKYYVEDIIRKIHTRLNHFPDRIFTRKDCLITETGPTKPLSHLKDRYPELEISLESTLIIDDQRHNIEVNPDQGILIPPFYPEVSSKQGRKISSIEDCDQDRALFDLIFWIWGTDVLKINDRVSEIDKGSIFA